MTVNRVSTLKSYYQNELDYLRNEAHEFAKDHPAIAANLQFNQGKSSDPHIELLLQSFAFLCGRLNYRLNAELPSVSNQLLDNLYPHLLAPIPSMAVVQAQVIPDGANFANGYRIARNRLLTIVGRSKANERYTCTARVCYDTDLWPLTISHIASEPTNRHDFLTGDLDVKAVLKVRIEATGAEPIKSFPIASLRFFIDGEERQSGQIFDLLSNHLRGIAIIGDDAVLRRQLDARIVPQGFEAGQDCLPNQLSQHPCYRILQEYFCFPQKFMFLDLEGLGASVNADRFFDLLLLLDREVDRSLVLSKSLLKLNCTPVINLFPKTTDPIRLDKTRSEYRLEPDALTHRYCEVHSVTKVTAVDSAGKTRVIAPYFALDVHADQHHSYRQPHEFWSVRREPSHFQSLRGSESYLSFFDLSGDALAPADDAVYANALCTNRDLMENLSIGNRFELEGGGAVDGMVLMTKPTRHHLPIMKGDKPWMLISQLTLNHLSLSDNPRALASFKNILHLHAGTHSLVNQRQIDSLVGIELRRCIERVGRDAWRGFCVGEEVILTIDEDQFQGPSLLLFGEVINQFLTLYADVNSFTSLVLKTKKQRDGYLKQWQPILGEQALV